jgi:hypothetical protein
MYSTIYHDGTWTPAELERFRKGEMIDRHGKRYQVCAGCRKIVCITRFGGFHLCA